MSRLIDLKGRQFGRWTVIERGNTYVAPNGGRKTTWLCRCECGKEKEVDSQALRRGSSASCGCLANGLTSKRQKIDMVGQVYGRLTVIKEVGRNKQSRVLWLCRCECGKERTIAGTTLRQGITRSCGCLNRELST